MGKCNMCVVLAVIFCSLTLLLLLLCFAPLYECVDKPKTEKSKCPGYVEWQVEDNPPSPTLKRWRGIMAMHCLAVVLVLAATIVFGAALCCRRNKICIIVALILGGVGLVCTLVAAGLASDFHAHAFEAGATINQNEWTQYMTAQVILFWLAFFMLAGALGIGAMGLMNAK